MIKSKTADYLIIYIELVPRPLKVTFALCKVKTRCKLTETVRSDIADMVFNGSSEV